MIRTAPHATDITANSLQFRPKTQKTRSEERVFSCISKEWCGREDSNFHGISPTATSTLRVYQFRHDRIFPCRKYVTCEIHGGR